MTALYDWLRAANLAVSLLLAAAMLTRGAAFLRAPVASRYGRLALFAWVTSTAYGTAEAMAQTRRPGRGCRR
jgi:ABC-type transport system involved in cytochrome c biogenesis permease subunit